jgi:pyruvate formate lyase activating enzyme
MVSTKLNGLIFDIKRFAVHDGPGIRTTVFLKGCPLQCLWCHSPESQRPYPELMYYSNLCHHCNECVTICPTQAQTTDTTHKIIQSRCTHCGRCATSCYPGALKLVGKSVGIDALLNELQKDATFYRQSQGGITLSGGEPTFQPQFTQALLKTCQDQYFHTAIETCGYTAWSIFQKILPYVNLILYDLKHLNRAKHIQYTGVPIDLILQNLRRLDQTDTNYVIRVPVIPTINDSPEVIKALSIFCGSLHHLKHVELLPYHRLGVSKYQHLDRPYSLLDLNPPQDDVIIRMSEAFQDQGLKVITERLPEQQ